MKSIDDACLSYNHEFGLMDEANKERLRREAREWIRALHLEDHDIEIVNLEQGIISNKLWPFVLSADKIFKHRSGRKAIDGWCKQVMDYVHTLPEGDD